MERGGAAAAKAVVPDTRLIIFVLLYAIFKHLDKAAVIDEAKRLVGTSGMWVR